MGSLHHVAAPLVTVLALAAVALPACKGQSEPRKDAQADNDQPEPENVVATAPPMNEEGPGPDPDPDPAGGTINEDFPGSFESQSEGAAPEGFTPGHNKVGNPCTWAIAEDDDSPIGSLVVAQENSEGPKTRFCTLAEDGVSLTDLEASVHCKPVSGELDQSCGLAFRYTNEDNYYVARANALEQNVRLYKVVNSVRSPIGEWSGSTPQGEWSTMKIKAEGTRYTVIWNEETVLELDDDTFPGAGSVALWTKADAVTHFDGLRYESLSP